MLFEISCWQDCILMFWNGHNSSKGDNSDKKKYGSVIFPWGIHIWNFKTLACMASIRFYCFFFQRGITPEREITQTRKKNVPTIFPWGIHIWNFKTLACTVLDERRTDNPKPICPVNFFKVGGITIPKLSPNTHLIWTSSRENPSSGLRPG